MAHLKDFEGKKSLLIRDLNIEIFTLKLKVTKNVIGILHLPENDYDGVYNQPENRL